MNYIPNGKAVITLIRVGQMKKILLYKMSYFQNHIPVVKTNQIFTKFELEKSKYDTDTQDLDKKIENVENKTPFSGLVANNGFD